MSRLTNQRGAITHDDRLDALSIAVAYWTEQMAQDADKRIKDRKQDKLSEELLNFQETYLRSGNSTTTTWF